MFHISLIDAGTAKIDAGRKRLQFAKEGTIFEQEAFKCRSKQNPPYRFLLSNNESVEHRFFSSSFSVANIRKHNLGERTRNHRRLKLE